MEKYTEMEELKGLLAWNSNSVEDLDNRFALYLFLIVFLFFAYYFLICSVWKVWKMAIYKYKQGIVETIAV